MAWTLMWMGSMMRFGRENSCLRAAEPADGTIAKGAMRIRTNRSTRRPTSRVSRRVQDPPPQPDSKGPYVVMVYEH